MCYPGIKCDDQSGPHVREEENPQSVSNGDPGFPNEINDQWLCQRSDDPGI